MNTTRNETIEHACAAMAAAIAQLIEGLHREGTLLPLAQSGTPRPRARALSSPKYTRELHHVSQDSCSGQRVYAYIFGSRGCADLARTYGTQIQAARGSFAKPFVVKCGTTTTGSDLSERLRQIGDDEYAAVVRTQSGTTVEPGFSSWIAHTIPTSRQPRDAAITLMPRAIAVDLPIALSPRAFDAAFHRAIKSRSLSSIAPAVIPKRFTAYRLIETRMSAATELYVLSPHEKADGDLLLTAIEDVLRTARGRGK